MGPNFKAIKDALSNMNFDKELISFVNHHISEEEEAIEKEFSSTLSIPCYKCAHAEKLDGHPIELAKEVRNARLEILSYVLFKGEESSNFRRLYYGHEETKIGLKKLEFKLFNLRQEQRKIPVVCFLGLAKNELPKSCKKWEWSGIAGLDEV